LPLGFGGVKVGSDREPRQIGEHAATARHHVRVAPVRLRRYNVPLDVLSSGVVGYRRECSCGARSAVCRTVRLARIAEIVHREGGTVGGGNVDTTHDKRPSATNPIARSTD
jgi:hypothetical protein